MVRRIPKSLVVVVAIVLVGNLVALGPAWAFMGIADTGDGILAAMLSQGAQALATANTTLTEVQQVRDFGKKAFTTAKDTYQLAKASAQMAQTGYLLASNARNFSAARFGQAFADDLTVAFPDVAYVRNEAANPLGLRGSYNPMVAAALKMCLADAVTANTVACEHLKGKQQQDQLDGMMSLAFGMKKAEDRAAATTKAELQEQTCEEMFRRALTQVEAERKLMAKAAAGLTDLRVACETGKMPSKSTYGVFQDIANDYNKVQADLAAFGDQAPKPDAAVAQSKAAACAELHQREDMIAKETEKYSRLTDLALKEMELCRAGREMDAEREKRTQEKLATQVEKEKRRQIVQTNGRVRPSVATKGDGYNIFLDPTGMKP